MGVWGFPPAPKVSQDWGIEGVDQDHLDNPNTDL